MKVFWLAVVFFLVGLFYYLVALLREVGVIDDPTGEGWFLRLQMGALHIGLSAVMFKLESMSDE